MRDIKERYRVWMTPCRRWGMSLLKEKFHGVTILIVDIELMTTQTESSETEKLARQVRLRVEGSKRALEASNRLDQSIIQQLESGVNEKKQVMEELKLYKLWMTEQSRIDDSLMEIEEQITTLEQQRQVLRKEKAQKRTEFIFVSPILTIFNG
jgi:hypothetical protein